MTMRSKQSATPGSSTATTASRSGTPARAATLNRSASKKPTLPLPIHWTGYYRIEGAAFANWNRDTVRTTTVLGYPTNLLANQA